MEELTFFQNRFCQFCFAPIADQEHASRIFCVTTYDEHNKVSDCKTSYHRDLDEGDRERDRAIVNKHKGLEKSIANLIAIKGYIVQTKDLNEFGINLNSALSIENGDDGTLLARYNTYSIQANAITNIHKILINGQF